MTSAAVESPSEAPAAQRGSLWRASAIHAERFGRRRIGSLATLASADQRVFVPHGVATLTYVRGRGALTAWTLAGVGAVGMALAAGVVAERPVTVATMAVLSMLATIAAAVVVDRRVRARRQWPQQRGAWQLADVAATRGAGAGVRIMGEVTRRADERGRPVVLAARTSAHRALGLYADHGFEVIGSTADAVRMRRAPASPARTSTTRRWSVALGAVLALTVMVLAWPSPVTWLVPPAAILLTAAAIVDLEQLRIPNALTAAGSGGLLVAVSLLQLETGDDVLTAALAGAALFAGPLLVMHVVTAARTPGLGDVKLAASAGLLCGAFDMRLALPALVGCCLLGAVMGTMWQRRTGRRSFPLAPAIALATATAVAVGSALDWIPT